MIKKIFRTFTAPIDTEKGALNNLPNFVIRWTIFMSANALFQAFADVIIEVLILSGTVSFKIPFRLEFLLLTFLSTLIAYLTLSGIREGNLDVTKNTLLIGFFVESSLVIGDIYLLATVEKDFWIVFLVRLGFLILTSSNIFIISYILKRRHETKKARPNYQF